jgi:hypothetical protein
MERNATMEGQKMETKRAKDLVAGDQVIERDGALLTVRAIVPTIRHTEIIFERYGVGPCPRTRVKNTARINVFVG